MKQGDAQRTAFTDEEISAIYRAVGSQADRVLILRNRAMVTVLLNSALQAYELLSLKVDSFDSSGGVSVNGKSGKRRSVTILTSGVKAVKVYLKARRKRDEIRWLTCTGDPLTKAGLRQMILTIRRRSSVAEGVYTHRFRHTAVTRLLKAGVPLRSVQLYAGHSDPQTTLRYAQAIDVDEAVAAVDGRRDLP